MNGEPNPWAPIGLPAAWTPQPLAWNLAKLRASGPAGVEDMHILIVHSANGTQGYKFSTDELRALADKLLEQATGLVVAGDVDPHPLRGFLGADPKPN